MYQEPIDELYKQDKMFLFKSYWYDTNIGVKVDHHHDLV